VLALKGSFMRYKSIAKQFVRLFSLLTMFVVCIPTVQGQTLTTLYSFQGGTDGAWPNGGLFRDRSGNLYGTTEYGGYSSNETCRDLGCGTVFKLSPDGRKLVYRFRGRNGALPVAGVIGVNDKIYGTTQRGNPGAGTVFDISRTGEDVFHFTDGLPGAGPNAALIPDKQGNLYGTTSGGGEFSRGVVFEYDAAGNETVLYSFRGVRKNGNDGASPMAALVMDQAGNLYGTTSSGGSGAGCGTVFELSGTRESVLYRFSGGTDGCSPFAEVALDSEGNFYGTTLLGGDPSCNSNGSCGVVFKLTSSGVETLLHTFTGGEDGAYPNTSVLLDGNGGLYGAASNGGTNDCGTIFRIDHEGHFSTLYEFSGPDGCAPQGDLILDSDGNIYGVTGVGGAFNSGTLFRLTPD